MTDYRRPDLDVWEEEDDTEDARPTIVAPRPQRPHGELDEHTSLGSSSVTLVESLPPEAALSLEPPAGLHAESVDDSDVVESDEVVEVAPPTLESTPAAALPSVASAPPALTAKSAALPAAKARFDSTERVILPERRFESLAPTTHSVRPAERKRAGILLWQVGAGAVVLLALGIGFSTLRTSLPEPRSAPHAAGTSTQQNDAQRSPLASASSAPSTLDPATVMSVAPPFNDNTDQAANDAPVAQNDSPTPERVRDQGPRPTGATAGVRRVRAQPNAAAAEPSPDGLPAQPSRTQVRQALNAVIPDLRKCVGGRSGTADVTLTVLGEGSVSHALVWGEYSGTPEGTCIARALVKTVKFPAFSEAPLRITYPFRLDAMDGAQAARSDS